MRRAARQRALLPDIAGLRHFPNINPAPKCPTQMSQSAADGMHHKQGGVSACRQWITIAPRRKSSKPSRKAKTVQSARPYSRVSPKAISGWLATKKTINGKSGKRPGLIPPARPAGPARADIQSRCPSARYISPQDAACTAIRWRTNGYPGCTILHPLPIAGACQPTTVPHRLIGCWRHRNSSALCSGENQPAKSVAPPDRLVAGARGRSPPARSRASSAFALTRYGGLQARRSSHSERRRVDALWRAAAGRSRRAQPPLTSPQTPASRGNAFPG
jgi:hypothetical protein